MKIQFGDGFANIVFGSSSHGVGEWVVVEAQVGLYVVMGVGDCGNVKVHVMVMEVMWQAGLVVVKRHLGIAVEHPRQMTG